ncbi:MAG TPA: hypothetical protein VHH73_10890 [Verrucomicrobiae bacterium]|nr:hypothetical protein [Verrucomicrobiae bacterium]
MSRPRTGKIGRLPRAIREQLNQRLHDGEQGPELLDWLNALPEVQAVLAAEFDGKPVNAQNLSSWRQGGYEDWLAHGEAIDLAQRLGEEIQDWKEQEQGDCAPLTEKLMVWLTARYAVVARQIGKLDEEKQWQRLREFNADLLKVRKVDQTERRLRLIEEKAALERKAREAKETASQADNHDFICWQLEKARRRLWGEEMVDRMNRADDEREMKERVAEAARAASQTRSGSGSNATVDSTPKTPENPAHSSQFKPESGLQPESGCQPPAHGQLVTDSAGPRNI